MGEITIPNDQPDASFGALGSRYYGIFRLPHGPWRQLLGRNKERLYFASAQEATRAAMAHVNGILFRPIRAEAAAPRTDPMEEKLMAEALALKAQRSETLRMERQAVERSFQHRAGRRAVEIITKKARRA